MPNGSRKKRLAKIAAIILLLPYALTIIYSVVPPPSTLMLADILSLHMPKHRWVPIERISPNLVAAVAAAEDSAFCDHYGFDFRQMEQSIDRASEGKKLRGASTITQQTAKNLFLWNGRSWTRKILEAPLTVWLEIVLPKRRIMEIYLNIAEWGPGVYGAEAAAKYHFGIPASSLSITQAALLASALPNPVKRSASSPGAGQLISASVIVRRVLNHSPSLACVK